MTRVVLVLLVALVISTGCGGASTPTGLSAPSTTQADAPLSDVERAWCIDNVWELPFALDRLGLGEDGEYPLRLGYDLEVGLMDERTAARRWANEWPDSYVVTCRAALGPR